MDKDNLLVALDVGTSKVAVIVAELNGEGAVKICGFGSSQSEGVRNGVVVDINKAVHSIRAAIDEAERTSGRQIVTVYTACEDPRLRFVNHQGTSPVRGPEVANSDMDAAIKNAKAVELKDDEKILKLLVQEFAVDGVQGITNPVGMSGNRLQALVHMACGLPTTAHNLLRCVRRCGVEVANWSIPVWAAANAVLTESEKDLGVCLVDIGAGTTDIAVYVRKTVRFTAIIPLGGEKVTQDIAAMYHLDEPTAETVKIRYGSADPSRFTPASVIDLADLHPESEGPGIGRAISQHELAEVEEARVREILSLVARVLDMSGLSQQIPAGIVFTGGVSQTDGFEKLTEQVFEYHCRLGAPDAGPTIGGTGSSPPWATAVGLLRDATRGRGARDKARDRLKVSFGKRVWSAIKRWFIGSY